jgi:capsular polysaccharide biosynthesis protein/DNA-dependent RNA polymerase auxiliary subunit epsilon
MDVSTELTVSDYVNALRRRRRLLFGVAVPILLGAVLLARILPDRYTAAAEIDINLEGSVARTLEPIEVTSYADQYIATLTDQALTRDNLIGLVQKPGLFLGKDVELGESDRVGRIRSSIDVSVLTQVVISPNSGREVDLISGFVVSSSGDNPDFVYEVADYAANLFLEADRKSRTARASSESNFLIEQIRLTEAEIVELEQQIADFKVANACCLPELVELNMSVIERAERDIEDIRPRIRALEQDRAFLQSQMDEIRQVTKATDRVADLEAEYMALVANYGQDHPDVIRLRREISALATADSGNETAAAAVELRMRLFEAEQKYSSEHPDVVSLRKQLATLERQGRSGVSAAQAELLGNPRYVQVRQELNSIGTELSELRAREPVLRQKISDYEARLSRTPQVESEFQAIDRKLQSARENYDDLQKRAVIAKQSEALESTDIGARLTEVVPARVPLVPSGPPRKLILILGIFLAGTLSIGSVLLAELADTSIRGSKDVMKVVGATPIATVPVIENSQSRKQRRRRLFVSRAATVIGLSVVAFLYFKGII